MPPGISSEKVSTPKRNCRTSTSCPSGVSAITFTQSGASITTKSRSVARTGWRNCTLCRSKMRVLTSVRRPRCSQRSGSANGGGFIGKNKNASRPQGEEAFKVFEKARGLFLRQLDLLADLQARRTDTRVHSKIARRMAASACDHCRGEPGCQFFEPEDRPEDQAAEEISRALFQKP